MAVCSFILLPLLARKSGQAHGSVPDEDKWQSSCLPSCWCPYSTHAPCSSTNKSRMMPVGCTGCHRNQLRWGHHLCLALLACDEHFAPLVGHHGNDTGLIDTEYTGICTFIFTNLFDIWWFHLLKDNSKRECTNSLMHHLVNPFQTKILCHFWSLSLSYYVENKSEVESKQSC